MFYIASSLLSHLETVKQFSDIWVCLILREWASHWRRVLDEDTMSKWLAISRMSIWTVYHRLTRYRISAFVDLIVTKTIFSEIDEKWRVRPRRVCALAAFEPPAFLTAKLMLTRAIFYSKKVFYSEKLLKKHWERQKGKISKIWREKMMVLTEYKENPSFK